MSTPIITTPGLYRTVAALESPTNARLANLKGSLPMMICSVCGQEIAADDETSEPFDGKPFHLYINGCVTATRLATARRCAEIAEEQRGSYDSVDLTISVIRKEFGIEEPK